MLPDSGSLDEETYNEFTPASLVKLQACKERLKDAKASEKNSAAKQAIFKGVNDLWTSEIGDNLNESGNEPDLSLEDGQELPQYYGHFPSALYKRLIEDVDPYYRERGLETFCVVSRRFGKNYVYRFSATSSFFIFTPFNPVRQWAIRTILHPAFDAIVMTIILINCVFLALDTEIANAEYVFTGLYTVEMVIKMIARGFILHPFTYLRDPWNWLDFVVVGLAYAAIFGTANVSSLRTFRVFRAFKSISIIPGLKTIVNALFHSMKPLAEVMFIMGFLLIVVSLIALQAYQGVLRRRCVREPGPADNITSDAAWWSYATNEANWNPVEGEEVVCGNNTGSGFCPTSYVCLRDVSINPNYGYTNFDNMGYALLTSFQLITLDYWENVYNMIIRAEGPWNVLFFLMSVFLGPFYLLNLLLAVVTLAYSKEHEKQEQLEEMRTKAKERAKRKNKRKEKLKEHTMTQKINSVGPDSLNNSVITSFGDVVSRVSKANAQDSLQVVENSLSVDNGPTSSISESEATNDELRSVSARNGASRIKLDMFRNSRADTSIESSDSSKTGSSNGWQRKWKIFQSWHLQKFCSWTCCPGFLFVQRRLLKLVKHKFFETFIMLCIIINTVFLAIDYHGITAELENALDVGNKVFTAIFTVEAVLKIVAMGPITYAKDLWNDFDFIIVFISIIELILDVSGGAGTNTGLTVLRTLRLLRVFRLARMWETMYKLVTIIGKSISAVSYLTGVLFLILYIFAVIGKQLYGVQYSETTKIDGGVPRWNFVDFYHSFMLVWRVMCGEWIEPLHDCLYITDNGLCVPFFLLITFVANFMILNLFTAILLEAFNVDNLKGKQEKEKQKTDKLQKTVDAFKSKLKKQSPNGIEPALPSSNTIDADELDPSTDESRPSTQSIASPEHSSGRRVSHASNIFELTNNAHMKRKYTQSSLNTVDESSEMHDNQAQRAGRKLTRQNSVRSMESDQDVDGRRTSKVSFCKMSGIEEGLNDDVPETMTQQNQIKIKKEQATSNGNTNHQAPPEATKKKRLIFYGQMCCCCIKTDDTKEAIPMQNVTDVEALTPEEENEEEENPVPDCLPLCLRRRHPSLNTNPTCRAFKYWMKIRKACFCLVEHKIFEGFILFLILSSTVCLAMEDYYLKDDPVKEMVLAKLEYIFTALFTMEMILKWIGIGPTKYFTSFWCVLDCAIVAVSWAGIVLKSQASQTGAFRSLRTLRALRPLRAVSRWQGMKVVVNALIYCIPSIGNVLCVCMLIWFVFGIMGVQFFKGQFYRCIDSSGNELQNVTITRLTCNETEGNAWVNRNINFDNVLNAMVALFQVATFEGWIEIMADASDIAGVDKQPIRENSKYYLIFFTFFILIGSFFILNLIVGVIIESFQKLRKQTESSSAIEALLTDTQKNFYKTMRTMLNRKPKKSIPPPTNRWQLHIFNLVTHSRFELVVFLLIVMNMVTLSMEHYQMSELWQSSLRISDITFTALFSLEAVLKLLGMRHYYFRDVFNVFDFIVIIVSITGFILENLLVLIVSPTLLRVVRVFRVFRVLRVVRAARGIRRLILTLMISIPALFNIAVLLGVFIVIFAILGMTSFMHVKLDGALNDQVNFRTFGSSLLVLFRLVTSAGWNDVLDPLMNTRNCNSTEDISQFTTTPADCGDPIWAVLYFVLFIFIVFLVIVNMYIAIILENFDEILQQDESGVSQGDFETFYMVWGRYDPRATQFVTLTELSNLLHDLHPPFQLPKPNLVKIGALDLPVLYGDKVHCLDVLFALVKRILGEVEISEDMRKEAEVRLLKSFPNRRTLKAETTTLVLRQQIRAAKIIQDAWKAFSSNKRRDFESISTPSLSSNVNEVGAGLSSVVKIIPHLTIVQSTSNVKILSKANRQAKSPKGAEGEREPPKRSALTEDDVISSQSASLLVTENNNNNGNQGMYDQVTPKQDNQTQNLSELIIENRHVIGDAAEERNDRPKSAFSSSAGRIRSTVTRPVTSGPRKPGTGKELPLANDTAKNPPTEIITPSLNLDGKLFYNRQRPNAVAWSHPTDRKDAETWKGSQNSQPQRPAGQQHDSAL